MAFVFTISIIINILTILAIVILYLRQNRLMELERKFEDQNNQFEDTVSSFLLQMKEENEQFLHQFQKINQSIGSSLQSKITDIEDSIELSQHSLHYPIENFTIEGVNVIQKGRESNSSADVQNNPIPEKQFIDIQEETVNPSPIENHENEISKIKTLLMEGLNVDEIAKSLNKGKTEIDLFIKFTPELASLLYTRKS